ncbi:MAG: AI-2E family transporter [Cyclobacteriaceae bacterium]
MIKEEKKTVFSTIFRFTIVLVGITFFVNFIIVGQSIIAPLVVAGFLSFLLNPFVGWLEKYRVPKLLASVLGLVAIILFISVLIYFFYSQIKTFDRDLGEVEIKLKTIRNNLPDPILQMTEDFSIEGIFTYLRSNISGILDGFINIASSLTLVGLMPIYIILMLYYRDFLYNFLVLAANNKNDEDDEGSMQKLVPKIRNIIQSYITGMFLVICVLFVLNSIALLSLGIKHAFLFAAFAALLNIVPFVGPLVGSALPIAFAFLTKDSLWYPFGVFIAFIVIQTIESNFLTPKIVGKNVSLNPLVTLITLLIGAKIWGIIGMILFIPGMAIIKEVFDNVDGLKPYGYLLGDPQTHDKQMENVNKRIKDIQKRLKLKKKNSETEDVT